jgi:hypothetical protein
VKCCINNASIKKRNLPLVALGSGYVIDADKPCVLVGHEFNMSRTFGERLLDLFNGHSERDPCCAEGDGRLLLFPLCVVADAEESSSNGTNYS